ncbi:unnamed protein product, partial [Ectocarpus sp. 12 AP-2014]
LLWSGVFFTTTIAAREDFPLPGDDQQRRSFFVRALAKFRRVFFSPLPFVRGPSTDDVQQAAGTLIRCTRFFERVLKVLLVCVRVGGFLLRPTGNSLGIAAWRVSCHDTK